MTEIHSKTEQDITKPEEEVSTSQGAYQMDPSEDKKALDKLWEAVLRSDFTKKQKPDNSKQAGVKSNSSSVDLPKLTVVFDLDSTLIYSSKKKLFPAQQCLASEKYFTAIRPHCITLLKNIRPLCNIMMFSLGTESYVNDVLTLIDPNGEYFE
ncbi:RNA polymerase II subunit A C-terminal domain phosphatase [Trichinella papuae]|uniref:Mitochondrial import inner membrane translocase subunit TIM50 n=1 Tax=Trichinella papuae TaxID=268474 RepID=A0A0V1M8S8_9BILA|nr:RNA polymerase II subunit A C-terminal domain phosphatase [Trichinella papuae]